jgi:hypothetical protein
MPHFWIQIGANPKTPIEMRDAARRATGGKDADIHLVDDEILFRPDEPTRGFATIKCHTEEQAQRYVERLEEQKLTASYELVLTADEIPPKPYENGDADDDEPPADVQQTDVPEAD